MKQKFYKSNRIKKYNIIKELDTNINSKDKITGLYNINNFFYCLKDKKNGTFIKVKLIGFNFINLTYGVKYGDEIIKQISNQLKEIGNNLMISRLSGTRFGIYIENIESEDIKQLIDKIFEVIININNSIDKINIYSNIVSITYKNNDFNTEDAINKLKQSTLNTIKKGFNKYELYNDRYESYIDVDSIERAIKKDEIVLYYQPKIDIKNGKIKGVEALIRWFNKDYGYIEPDKLIGFAEDSGYINVLGKWILKKACREIKEINNNLEEKIELSVNISQYQLQDKYFLKYIKDIIREIKFEEQLLKLEVTENEKMESIEKIHDIFEEIKSMGIKISIDDFGKGYNSIDYIKNYNIDEIKLDKSLIQYINHNPLFIKNLVNMIHTTNTCVVAEGVEEEFEYKTLQKIGCDLVQGYYCYKPMELNKLLEVVKEDAI